MGKSKIPETGIYDARQLGTGRMLLLGFQHMFAMFGATVLVPILTGLDVSNTLLFAGLGTLLFHLITGGKVPAFLGSSFAFIGGYAAIAPMLGEHQDSPNLEMLPYACFGVACAGLVYVILAALFKAFGAKKVMRFFPPIVTGPIIIAIGLTLSSSAINNCTGNWWIAIVAIAIVVACQHLGQGHDQDHPDPPRRHRLLCRRPSSLTRQSVRLRPNVSRSRVVRPAHPAGAAPSSASSPPATSTRTCC